MESEVNLKFVLGLEEQPDKTLQMVKIDIPQSNDIIKDLESMQEDPNKNLYDMSSYFYNNVRPFEVCYNYCTPEEYNKTHLNGTEIIAPKYIAYWEYREVDTERRNTLGRWIFNNKNLSEQEKEKKWNEYIHELDYDLKKKYCSKAKKYILCMNLDSAIKEITSNTNIKIHSFDTIGFNQVIYNIDENVKVWIGTNFGYGNSSYFYLTIKYKDIILIPYSDLVHFYYANMKSLIAHTKSYSCQRDSWIGLMDYVSEFVNNSRQFPERFVRDYVLNEIQIMMKGLRNIIKNPEEVFEQISTINQGNVRFTTLRPFTENEFKIYKTNKKEITSVFKIEKITGALYFIENLKSFKEICFDIGKVIDEIIELNQSIAPELPPVLESIEESIKPRCKDLEVIKIELKIKEARFEKLERKLDWRLSYCKSDKDQQDCKRRFNEQYPQYELLSKEVSDLNNKYYSLERYIKRREELHERITECQNMINKYI